METKIGVKGRSPTPRIINVKQYSSGVDRIVFTLEEVFGDKAVCAVVGKDCRQSAELDGNRAVWNIAEDFTRKSGSFDIQLEITDEERVWKSDVMLLIVSRSTEGNKPASGGGFVSGMPYDEGMVAWFDFTGYNGEGSVENKSMPDGYNPLTVYGGTAGESELVINGTAGSYAITDLMIKKASFTLYTIAKADEVKTGAWNANTIFGLSYSVSSNNFVAASSGNGQLKIALYGADLSSRSIYTDYIVIALTASESGLEFYVNGVKYDSTASYNIGRYLALGANVINDGSVRDYNNNPLRFKMLSLLCRGQTEEEIAANSVWLYEKYITPAEQIPAGRTYLLKSGKEIVPFYRVVAWGTGLIENGVNCIQITSDSGSYTQAVLNTQNKIDLTGCSRLVFEIYPISLSSQSVVLGYSDDVTVEPVEAAKRSPFWASMIAGNTYTKMQSGKYLYEIDVSEVSGEYYIGLVSDTSNTSYVKSIWLE